MGEVYKAYDEMLDRHVAIKSTNPFRQMSPEVQTQLQTEARAAAAIDHPAVAQIYDVLAINDRVYLVMECVDGQSLLQRLKEGPIGLEQGLRLGLEIAAGLDAAHGRGVVHRDLKPGNVMVTPDGHAKILDFGLAKIPAEAEPANGADTRMIGTLSAMSPEQLGSGPVDHRSDLFALGTLLYELTTGVHPFRGGLPPITACNILSHEPPSPHKLNPEVPVEVSRSICALLEKDPDRRPGSARDLIGAVRHHQEQRERAARQPRPQRWVMLGMALATLLFIISGISRRIHIWEGAMYLAVYALFVGKLFGIF